MHGTAQDAFVIAQHHLAIAGVTLLLALLFRRRTPGGMKEVFFLLAGFALGAGAPELEAMPDGLEATLDLTAAVCLTIAAVRVGWTLVVGLLLNDGARLGLSRLTVDLLQAGAVLLASLYAAGAAGADPKTLATTGGLVTAGLTFSLQQTLSDLVAGIMVQGQRPFRLGDWIQYDDNSAHIGQVVEVNWRATKVVSLDRVEITVPNSTLARASIVNFHQPTKASRRSIYFAAPYDVSPTRVQDLVLEAIKGSEGVLEDPAPSVAVFDFNDFGVKYWVRFFLEEQGRRDMIDSGVRVRIWNALGRAGIQFAVPRRHVELVEDAEGRKTHRHQTDEEKRLVAFKQIDFLHALGDQAMVDLARRCRTQQYARGETVVTQGSAGRDFYVVASGKLAVNVNNSPVAQLTDSQFFGEMALLTGEPRSASVVCSTDCTLYVVDKDTFREIVLKQPEVLQEVSRVVAERQAALAAKRGAAQSRKQTDEAAVNIGALMKRLFGVG